MTPVTLLAGLDEEALDRLMAQPALTGAAIVHAGPTSRIATPGARCPCCVPGGSLARALRALLPGARRGEITRVMIVAGGADPASILALLREDFALASTFRAEADATPQGGTLDGGSQFPCNGPAINLTQA